MDAISDAELLLIWEAAQAASPLLRPAEVLRAAGEGSAPELLPIGARDRRLLALRQSWFGSAFEALADCPHCGACAELAFDARAIEMAASAPADDARFRLPDTLDLAAIADAADEDEARDRLAARCINSGSRHDATVLDAMSAADPDLSVAVTCPECGETWEALFDPAAFVLRELDAAAVRIFREIDALATAYGWNESEILALSRARRRTYLRLVTA